MTPEARIKAAIRAHLDSLAPDVWYTVLSAGPYSVRGLPDIVACVSQVNGKGRFLAIEVKSATGRPTALQQHTLNRIKEAGGGAIIARSVADVKKALDTLYGIG